MTKPAPYPPDTRAKGWRFELAYEQIEQSDTWAVAAEVPMAQHALLMCWLAAWTQVPCGSMPADENLFRLKCKLTPDAWASMRDVLGRGWWLADDGRLYHPTLTARVAEMMRKRRSDADRQATRRAKTPPEPPPDIDESHADVTRDKPVSHTEVRPESNTGTESNTVLPTSIDRNPNAHRAHEESATHGEVTRDTQRTPVEVEFAATKAGAIGQALKRGGIDPMQINLSDPMLAALIEQGATPDEFEGLAKDAVSRGIDRPYAWVLAVLPKKRAAAAKLALAAPAAAPPPNTQVASTDALLAAHRAHMAETASPEARQRAAAALAQARKAITRGAAA